MATREKAAVIGLGYVGIPLASLLADRGYAVVGMDIDPQRVGDVNEGRVPLKGDEPDLQPLLAKVVRKGWLKASEDFGGCRQAKTVFVCVDTPVDEQMRPDNRRMIAAAKRIGENLSKGTMVVVESTVAPGTMLGTVAPIIEGTSGLRLGRDFKLAHCPERVMPGRLLHNLTNYDRVLGSLDDESARRAEAIYSKLTAGELHRTGLTTAEVVKTAENAYRDVQIAFANEVSSICEKLGVDAFEVRKLVNTSPFRDMHLPGAGVGGHCLPKDPWLLAFGGREAQPVLIPTARMINDGMPFHVAELTADALRRMKVRRASAVVAVLGASYTGDAGDIRNSPTASLISCLEGVKEIRVHDPFVDDLYGVNVLRRAPDALKGADVAVFMVAHKEYARLTPSTLKKHMRRLAVVDGRNLFSEKRMTKAGFVYRGVGKGLS
ncbi:MAG: nucleotide sugar dehydrogenase [Methanobacteriota archaeon]|nr:MAG: nucleotide sugar dehydrogenase [Euryarchaeota archaeon]